MEEERRGETGRRRRCCCQAGARSAESGSEFGCLNPDGVPACAPDYVLSDSA